MHNFKSTLLLNFNASSTIVQNDKGYTLDEVIDAAGGFSWFQLYMMATYILGFCAANFILYNIDYLTQRPVYMCETVPGSGDFEQCTNDDICGADPPVYYFIDWTQPTSLNNWSQTLDLMCVDDDRIQRISSVYYMGEVLGCLIICRIPDVLGRKWPYIVCIALQLPLYIVLYFSRDLELTTGVGFFMGILHIGIANGGYINVCEYVHARWKNFVCTLMLVFDMLTVIATGVYWKFISQNASWLLISGILFNALSLIGLFFVPETPEYLYSFYRFRECREVMYQIAKWNRSQLYNLIKKQSILEKHKDEDDASDMSVPSTVGGGYLFDVEVDLKQIRFSKQIAEKNEKFIYSITKAQEYKMEIEIQRSIKAGVSEFMKNKEYVLNLGLNMLLWALTDMNYQINDYYNNYFPGDNYTDTIAIATVELFGYIFACIIFEAFKQKKSKKSYVISYCICLCGSITLIFNDKEAYPWWDLACNFICKFGIASAFQSAFLTNELFPIVFASTTFGICSMMSSISSVLSVYEIYTSEGESSWILFSSLCVLGIVLSLLQKEE